jgi:inosine-uridine nucleoside N-ribohydrolase
MHLSLTQTAGMGSPTTESEARMHLRGTRLVLARLAWVAMASLSLLLVACGSVSGTGPSARATALPVASSAVSTVPPRPVVIDTDMAADDWMALLYLLRRPDVAVKAITVTGDGEAHCESGIRHARGLVALANRGVIPVACGRTTPLQGDHAFPAKWRADVDTLLGLTLPPTTTTAAQQTAVDLLTSVIQASPQQVVLLTLGPLTNVAEAVQRSPALVKNLAMIYIMGGAVEVSGNIADSGAGIANHVAEWNLYVDPHAAQVVLASGAPTTLVPLDATNHVQVTDSFYQRLKADHLSPVAGFVFDVLTQRYALIQSGGYYFWDPLAAAILTDDSLATFQTRALSIIETQGPESGRTQPSAGGARVRVAVSASGARFEQIFLSTLND